VVDDGRGRDRETSCGTWRKAPPRSSVAEGCGEIGFTIVSITLSLIAVFIPLFLMGGYVGCSSANSQSL